MKKTIALLAGLLIPMATYAQGTNEGASVTAPFVVNPPTIDGVVSDGEWDAAGVATGDWSEHNTTTLEDANFPTTVKVLYSIDGLYVLYECVDDAVLAGAGGSEYLGSGPAVEGQGQPFTFAGDTDYVACYFDPTNYADAAPNSSFFSYSIQAEPAVTATDGAEDSSYIYTEAGQNGRFFRKFDPPIENPDGFLQYWAGGVSWEGDGIEIVDGPTADGYVMEWFFPWSAFDGYYSGYAEDPIDGFSTVNGDNTDEFLIVNGLMHAFRFADDNTPTGAGFGNVTGMPMPGTEWKVQFSRYTSGAAPAYTNWVGDTGGFVTRPFGSLVFGEADATAVREAMMHMN